MEGEEKKQKAAAKAFNLSFDGNKLVQICGNNEKKKREKLIST